MAARVRSAVPSSEKHAPEIPKGAPAGSVTAAGGRGTGKPPLPRQPVAPGSTNASAQAKGASTGSPPPAPTPSTDGSAVKPLPGSPGRRAPGPQAPNRIEPATSLGKPPPQTRPPQPPSPAQRGQRASARRFVGRQARWDDAPGSCPRLPASLLSRRGAQTTR